MEKDVFVHRRLQGLLALDTVQASTQHDRQGKIRVATGIRATQLDAHSKLRIATGPGNANQPLAIHTSPVNQTRCFKSWYQAFVRVDERGENSTHAACMRQLPGNKIATDIRKPILVLWVSKSILACGDVDELLMDVQSRAIDAVERFG